MFRGPIGISTNEFLELLADSPKQKLVAGVETYAEVRRNFIIE